MAWTRLAQGCALAVLLFSTSAFAQTEADRQRARAAFQRGVEAYENDEFQRALQAFQEAYRIAPHPSVRVNMANCYEQLERPVEAIDHFERFLIESGDDVPAEQRTEVRASLARLRAQIGEVFFRIEPDGAQLTIDGGHHARRAPILDAVPLVQGPHRVEVTMPGHVTVRREIDVSGGGRLEVAIALRPGTNEGSEGVGTPDPDGGDLGDGDGGEGDLGDGGEGDLGDGGEGGEGGELVDPGPEGPAFFNTPAIISLGATGALLGGTILSGALALSANSDFDAAVVRSNDASLSAAEREQARLDGLDAKDKANRRAIFADVLLGATIAGLAVTAYFLFLWSGDENEDGSAAQVGVLPVAGRGAGGVSVVGAF